MRKRGIYQNDDKVRVNILDAKRLIGKVIIDSSEERSEDRFFAYHDHVDLKWQQRDFDLPRFEFYCSSAPEHFGPSLEFNYNIYQQMFEDLNALVLE